jgi:hypothetical protein
MRDIDLLADLPPPDDFEPPSLRNDIRDELGDHLQCAFRREVLRDGDEPAAQTRVLNRFGDPKQIARRLWWQAMWSRVMGKRLLAGLQWMVTLAAVFAAGAVYVTNSRILGELESARTEDQRSTASLAQELQELRHQIAMAQNQADGRRANGQPGATDGPPGAPGDADASAVVLDSPAKKPSLTVQLVYDREDRPPVEDPVKEIALVSGHKRYEGVLTHGEVMPGESGRYVFTAPGGERYDLIITLADGQTSTRNVLVRDDLPREMTVVCPEPRTTVAVSITGSPLPEDLQDACGAGVWLKQNPAMVVEAVEWRLPNVHDQEVAFNDAGKVTWLHVVDLRPGGGTIYQINLGAASEDDRRIVLVSGPVDIHWAWYSKSHGGGSMPVLYHRGEPFSRTVKPGEDHWELEIPEELIADMRKDLAAAKKASD